MNVTFLIIHMWLLSYLPQNAESAKKNATAEKHMQVKEATVVHATPHSSDKHVVEKVVDTPIPLIDTIGAMSKTKQKPQY